MQKRANAANSQQDFSWMDLERMKLKFAASLFVSLVPGIAVAILLGALFGFGHKLIWCVGTLVSYSVCVFLFARLDTGSNFLKPDDKRSMLHLFSVHAGCLAIILILFQLVWHQPAFLPHYFVGHSYWGDISWYELMLVGSSFLLFFLEAGWLSAKKQQK